VPNPGSAGQFGRLDVFNIETGEVRSARDVRVPVMPALVTPDARFLFSAGTGADGQGIPRVHLLGPGTELSLPDGELGRIWALSAARGLLLVGVPFPGAKPNQFDWQFYEVPLSRLTAS
jgi:hypothetical protein